MLLTEAAQAFDAPGWTAELKYDGYRLLLEVLDGRVRIRTRNGAEATAWYPELQGLGKLAGRHILDGEGCCLDELGRSDFVRFHERSRRRGRPPGAPPVVFCAFDLLVHRGIDIRAHPLARRKATLKHLLAKPPRQVLLVQDLPGKVQWLYDQAVALGLEGILAKRLDSPYLSGQRSAAWVKIKRPKAVPAKRFAR